LEFSPPPQALSSTKHFELRKLVRTTCSEFRRTNFFIHLFDNLQEVRSVQQSFLIQLYGSSSQPLYHSDSSDTFPKNNMKIIVLHVA
jgi:UDP-N-acetylglucosamine pyrophosphorylase